MSLNRRDALAISAACCFISSATRAGEPAPGSFKPDPVLANVPQTIRPIFERAFPNHRCIRLAMRPIPGKPPTKGVDNYYYRVTLFDPANTTVRTGKVGEEIVSTPILYEMEVSEDGEIMEETIHPVLDAAALPKKVVAAYEKWNPMGVAGMARPMWYTELPRGGERKYLVSLLISSVTAYGASFREDGTVISAEPKIVP